MDDNELLDELIGRYEDAFRREIQNELDSGNLSKEQHEVFLPVLNKCIELFAWTAAMQFLIDVSSLK